MPPCVVDVDDEDIVGGIDNMHINKSSTSEAQMEQIEGTHEVESELPRAWKYTQDHPMEQILGDPSRGITTRSRMLSECGNVAFLSQLEPKKISDALLDEFWVLAMHEELNNFQRNNVWKLVPRPNDYPIIGTRWVFRNKLDEFGVVTRNKARLVAQGFNQEEGIDYDETFAPVARLESIRMLLAFASF